jgi:hypothetical protein
VGNVTDARDFRPRRDYDDPYGGRSRRDDDRRRSPRWVEWVSSLTLVLDVPDTLRPTVARPPKPPLGINMATCKLKAQDATSLINLAISMTKMVVNVYKRFHSSRCHGGVPSTLSLNLLSPQMFQAQPSGQLSDAGSRRKIMKVSNILLVNIAVTMT